VTELLADGVYTDCPPLIECLESRRAIRLAEHSGSNAPASPRRLARCTPAAIVLVCLPSEVATFARMRGYVPLGRNFGPVASSGVLSLARPLLVLSRK
jgi:hypothetical protein